MVRVYENRRGIKVRKLFNYRYNSGDERHHGLYSRAGVVPGSAAFENLLEAILGTSTISLYGFYCHAGDAYGSTSPSQASSFLTSEIEAVNKAAKMALDRMLGSPGGKVERPPFVLSIGATPTAHCASAETRARLQSLLHGTLVDPACLERRNPLTRLRRQAITPCWICSR